jgi:hypothetical protein
MIRGPWVVVEPSLKVGEQLASSTQLFVGLRVVALVPKSRCCFGVELTCCPKEILTDNR